MKTKILFILFFSVVIISCNDLSTDVDCSTYDYSDCITIEPTDGEMYLKLTINNDNKSIPVAFYRGKLEDNALLFYDTLTKEYFDTLLPVGNYYTVTAEYLKEGKKIIAIDGDNITKKRSNVCDSVCWEVVAGNVYLRLK